MYKTDCLSTGSVLCVQANNEEFVECSRAVLAIIKRTIIENNWLVVFIGVWSDESLHGIPQSFCSSLEVTALEVMQPLLASMHSHQSLYLYRDFRDARIRWITSAKSITFIG